MAENIFLLILMRTPVYTYYKYNIANYHQVQYFNGGILSVSVNHTTWYSPLMEMHNVVVCVCVFAFVRSVVGGVSVGDLFKYFFSSASSHCDVQPTRPQVLWWSLGDVCNNNRERLKSLTLHFWEEVSESLHTQEGVGTLETVRGSFDRSTPVLAWTMKIQRDI